MTIDSGFVQADGDAPREGIATRLLPEVYDELRGLAAAYAQRRSPGHTLRPTEIVHEAFMRMVSSGKTDWRNRAYFFSVAAEMIRRVMVDQVRRRAADKRGGAWRRVTLDEQLLPQRQRELDLMVLDETLQRLSSIHPRQGRVVELRFFGGLALGEVAEVLGVSRKTVTEDWQFARAWLSNELAED